MKAPLCVSHQTSMDVVVDLFKKIGVSILLVTHFGYCKLNKYFLSYKLNFFFLVKF